MNIYVVLTQDHERLAHLLTDMEAAMDDSRERREELVDEFERLLTGHLDAEELVFYEALRRHSDIHNDVERVIEEHAEISDALDDLKNVIDDAGWETARQQLQDRLFAHVETEEKGLFSKAKTFFTEDDAVEYGTAYLREKERIISEL